MLQTPISIHFLQFSNPLIFYYTLLLFLRFFPFLYFLFVCFLFVRSKQTVRRAESLKLLKKELEGLWGAPFPRQVGNPHWRDSKHARIRFPFTHRSACAQPRRDTPQAKSRRGRGQPNLFPVKLQYNHPRFSANGNLNALLTTQGYVKPML